MDDLAVRAAATNVVAIGEPLIGDVEAARILDLAAQTLRNDRVNRRLGIPFYRIGRSCKYKRSDLEAWISKHAVTTEPEAA